MFHIEKTKTKKLQCENLTQEKLKTGPASLFFILINSPYFGLRLEIGVTTSNSDPKNQVNRNYCFGFYPSLVGRNQMFCFTTFLEAIVEIKASNNNNSLGLSGTHMCQVQC